MRNAHLLLMGFGELGPKNPLRKLMDSDKVRLMALLVIYENCLTKGMPSGGPSELLEEAAKIADLAGALGNRMQAAFFEGPLAPAFAPLLAPFNGLPQMLQGFSRSRLLLESISGKSGYKGTVARNQFLVMASEFVVRKTGSYHDESVAELLQTLCSDNDGVEIHDVSGDAIHKKRLHFQKTYPLLHAYTVNQAVDLARKSERQGLPPVRPGDQKRSD